MPISQSQLASFKGKKQWLSYWTRSADLSIPSPMLFPDYQLTGCNKPTFKNLVSSPFFVRFSISCKACLKFWLSIASSICLLRRWKTASLVFDTMVPVCGGMEELYLVCDGWRTVQTKTQMQSKKVIHMLRDRAQHTVQNGISIQSRVFSISISTLFFFCCGGGKWKAVMVMADVSKISKKQWSQESRLLVALIYEH